MGKPQARIVLKTSCPGGVASVLSMLPVSLARSGLVINLESRKLAGYEEKEVGVWALKL